MCCELKLAVSQESGALKRRGKASSLHPLKIYFKSDDLKISPRKFSKNQPIFHNNVISRRPKRPRYRRKLWRRWRQGRQSGRRLWRWAFKGEIVVRPTILT